MASDSSATLRQLSIQEKSNALTRLRSSRAKEGFKTYIHDLRSKSLIENGWELASGTLTIQPGATDETYQEVQRYIENTLSAYAWYSSVTQFAPAPYKKESVQLSDHSPYGMPFKILGKNGPNAAVDAVILIPDKEGRVKLLTIHRPGKGLTPIGVPGGFDEGGATNTYVAELLEEVFSNDLFRAGSATEALIDRKGNIDVFNELTSLFNKNPAFEALKELSLPPFDGLTPSKYIRSVLAAIKTFEKAGTDVQKEHLCVLLKCCLYQQLLPEQYKAFKEIVSADKIQLQPRVNQSDSRNTDYAWMITTPFVRVMDEATFARLEKDAGLCVASGDDAQDARFCRLEQFWAGQRPIFCDHGVIVLDAVAEAIDEGKLTLTATLERQLTEIEKKIQADSQQLGLRDKGQEQESRDRISAAALSDAGKFASVSTAPADSELIASELPRPE